MEDWLCIFGGIQMALGFQCQPLSWLRELARRCYRGWDGGVWSITTPRMPRDHRPPAVLEPQVGLALCT